MNTLQTVNVKKYIEIDSTYRNRNIYPLPAQFKINVGNAGQEIGLNNARDPVTDGTSEWVWRGIGDLPRFPNTLTLEGVPNAVKFIGDDNEIPGRGYFVRNGTDPVVETALIDNIVLPNINTLNPPTAVLETPFSDAWVAGGAGEVVTYETGSNVYFPFADQQDNSFNDWYLTRISTTQNTVSSTDDIKLVTGFSEKFRIMNLQSTLSGFVKNDTLYQLAKDPPFETGTTPSAGVWTGRTAELPAGSSAVDDFYNGKIIKFINIDNSLLTGSPNGNILPTYYTVIEDYDGATRVATLRDPVPDFLAGFRGYSITNFTEDAYSFLNVGNAYENKRRLYRVSCNNLILPNQILANENGGRPAFYPYVYVVLSNTSIGTFSLISSNNPNSRTAVFRCPIGDTDNPETATFLKLRSNQIQTFEFNIYEDIIFEVYLPNGILFQTLLADTISPIPPNPNLQISTAFSFELAQLE